MKYLIIIPAYNEQKYIKTLLGNLTKVASDVVVVDDGSTDSTPEIARGTGVEVITQRHQGKGAALRTGFNYAVAKGYDWVITMDSDCQHDWQDVPRFVEAMTKNGTSIIVGSRLFEAGRMPVVRRLTNKFMSGLISRLIRCRVPDTQCGFRAINSTVLKGIRLETSHYDTESELLIKSGKAGYKISFIPIKTIYNGAPSNINKFTDTMRFLKLLVRTI
ncbi:MAG: glycosyltransferase family 2 protein [Deltaproteobacteria bacterium]|nr:glycosyltransferase family 2 protein [Deltaproteobacteria bacterium]